MQPMMLELAASMMMLTTAARPPSKHNVVLIVIDGLRSQEMFSGASASLMGREGGVTEDAGGLKAKFWRQNQAERRETLMPFIWRMGSRHGRVLASKVTNTSRVSYPGYNELLTGRPDDERVASNAAPANPNVTVFEAIANKPGMSGKVQAFATWDTFFRIFNVARSKLDVRAGLSPPFENDAPQRPARRAIDQMFRSTTPMFGGNALDAMTFVALNESLTMRHPKLLFVGFGEVDEWMHAGRYDLALEAAHRADGYIASLWHTMQSMPEYKGKTTFIITTDHGRGGDDNGAWRDHGAEVEGSDDAWVAVIGPGAHGGFDASSPAVTQSQVAATIAALLGYDSRLLDARASSALPLEGHGELSLGW